MSGDGVRPLTVGLLIGSTSGIYAENILRHLSRETEQAGMQLLVFHCEFLLAYTEDIPSDDIILQLLGTNRIDALLVSGMVSQPVLTKINDRLQALETKIPVISLTFQSPFTYGVMIDNRAGFRDLFSHLLDDHGYTKVAFIGGPKGLQEAEIRKQVYIEALQARGLTVREDWIVHGDFLPPSGVTAMKALMAVDDTSFQGVVVASDEMAITAMQYLQEIGYRVPEDYFITGFDGFKRSPLTTVYQSISLHMESAVMLIKSLITPAQEQKQAIALGDVIEVPSFTRVNFSCGCTPARIVKQTALDFHQDVELGQVLDKLSKALKAASQTANDQLFLSALTEVIDADRRDHSSMKWQSLLSLLRANVCKVESGEEYCRYSEQLIDQGFMYITAHYLGREHLKRFHRVSTPFKLQQLNQNLGRVQKFEELSELLAKDLPSFGFSSVSLSTIESAIAGSAMLRLYYKDYVRVELPQNRHTYPLVDLLPREHAFFDTIKNIVILQPLMFHKSLLGYMMIESNALGVPHIYTICSYISNAIQSIFLWEERLRTEERMIQSEKMASLGQLVAGVAHEINTPIGIGVTTASDLIHRTRSILAAHDNKTMTKSQFEDFLHVLDEETRLIENNLARAANLIRSFKRVAVDQTSEQLQPFLLAQYIQDIIESLRPKLKGMYQHVVVNCPEDLTLYGPPGTIAQLISNLIINSIVHGFDDNPNGKIIIECTALKDNVHIHYSDNGSGMEEAVRKRIFDPFFTTKMGQGGSGLGLHVVYNLVHKIWQGNIYCESASGRGADFFITLRSDCRSL